MNLSKDFILAAILAVVLSFVLFGNGIGGNFIFDDTIVIVGNPFIGEQLDEFWEIFTNPYFAHQPRPGLYRPLTIASYSLNAFLFGSSPAGFHIVNILLYALTSFLVFVLLYRLSSSKIAAFSGFLFFMFLPIHTEAVTSIVGRAEILSLLFVVGALLSVLKQRYLFASVLFLFGLLSKEMAVAFLPVFLFLEFYQNGKNIKKTLKSLLYFIPAIIFYAVLRYAALGEYFLKNDATMVHNPIMFAGAWDGLWTSFKVLYLYLEKIFWPLSLSIDYSFNQIPIVENFITSPQTIIGIAVLVLAVALFLKTKEFLIKFGVVFFLASYFVISNWVFKTGTIMAERLMFTPSLGIAAIVGAVFARFAPKFRNKRLFYGSVSVVLIFYGLITIGRNKVWLNEKYLYESAYVSAPNSVVNKTNKAYLEFIDGKYEEAEKRLNGVLTEVPNHVPAIFLAGQNYKKLGKIQKAETYWQKAISLNSNFLRAYLSLGVLYYENGYFKSAEKVLTDAVNIYPRWSEVLFLALAKVGLKNPDEAIELIRKHFGDEPSRKELRFALGWAYLNKGERQAAYKYFSQVKDSNISINDFVKTFEGSKVIILGEF